MLSSIEERFILHWGEMGSRWGVNRSVAQVHALLFLKTEPLSADQIVELLSIARSNVSMSLKELQAWDLVQTVPVRGDRKEYFTTDTDVWALARKIALGRKQREIDPTLTVLRDLTMEAEDETGLDPVTRDRITQVLRFMETLDSWFKQISRLPNPILVRLIGLGDKISKLVS